MHCPPSLDCLSSEPLSVAWDAVSIQKKLFNWNSSPSSPFWPGWCHRKRRVHFAVITRLINCIWYSWPQHLITAVSLHFESFGVGNMALRWFQSHLRDWTQSVHLAALSTAPRHVEFRIPQGSVLGRSCSLCMADISSLILDYVITAIQMIPNCMVLAIQTRE